MSVRIEPAGPDRARPIAELLLRCAPDCVPLTEGEVRERLDDMVVAVDPAGRVVGCASHETTSLGPEVRSVAVSPSHRGHGLGRRLVQEVLRRRPGPMACVTRRPTFFHHFGFGVSSEAVPRPNAPPPERARFVMRRPDERSSSDLPPTQ
ncbi:MAG: GNAT family N-acetyltransferase [Sandaracinaceae bacterium]